MGVNIESPPVSSHHLQQQELVTFLYDRFRLGRHITLFVSLVASSLAYVELSIQGREHWVVGWFALLCLVMLLRARQLRQFLEIRDRAYFPYQLWHDRFLAGVIVTGLMLGCGAALLMPYITIKVQIILHSILLIMVAGAIAYLSTSLRAYIAYMVTIMVPVTLWLLLQQTSATYVLGSLYMFFMVAGFISVKRMHELVNDALYYRYDNETLIDDLQRLLQSVSQSNKALEKISTSDELTGVSNYRAFRVQLEDVWRQYRGSQEQVSLIKLNVDYYHEFNAHYGQEAGDRHLQQLASLLNKQLSHQNQMVARLHGAEFALLLPGVSCEDARRIAVNIRKAFAENKIQHIKSACADHLTLSIGLGSQTVTTGGYSRELLIRSDTALKLAKERGRDRLEVLQD